MLAERNDRYSVIRTCAQTSTHHQSAAYEALTGFPPSRDAVALTASPADHPNLGSVVAKLAPGMVDFTKKVSVQANLANLTPVSVQPSLETLLEDYYQRGERERVFVAKLTLTP